MFGFININKPIGMTSFDVVAKLRKILNIKQIGHTGTLDPFAQGVLPICIGKATKLIEYMPDDKEYIATVQFGKCTTTYDIEGEIIQTFDKKITQEDIINTLKNFQGEIEQTPPIYSAIKVKGKKLYEYAREGKSVEIKPRKVFISKIQLLSFDEKEQSAQIFVACSKGTYIRSIANDIGQIMNCGGYLTNLIRTKAGNFSIDNSIKLDNITSKEIAEQNIINPLNVLNMPKYELTTKEHKMVCHGMNIKNKDFFNGDIVFLIYGGKINAIGMVSEDKILMKKVFEVL